MYAILLLTGTPKIFHSIVRGLSKQLFVENEDEIAQGKSKSKKVEIIYTLESK